MIDEPQPVFAGNAFLKRLDFRRMEFNHFAGFQVDQVIVMFFRHRFIARTAIAEIVAGDNACILEEFQRAIDR